MPPTRILVVDDDPHSDAALRRLLQGEGYIAEVASSVAEAFRRVCENPPDLVLADLQTPEVDAIALCRSLQVYRPELPVIVVTGLSSTSLAVRALQAGAEDYLLKPVNFAELVVSIRRAIGRRAAAAERQRARMRVAEQSLQALAAANAQQEALSIVAHDLRTPLGVIALWAEQLLRTETPDTLGQVAQRGLSVVSRNATNMQRLIADLMDESRLRTGQLPLDRNQHSLSQILADVSELRPLAKQRGVVLEVTPPERDCVISCDRGRMNQVLGNLVANAIKFGPSGSTVTVWCEVSAGVARFAVRDQGPGIAPDATQKIFERFWQIDRGRDRGVGLGLYIVKGIVQSHGGHVWVESRLGAGSTFFVSLPCASVASRPAVGIGA